LFARPSHQRQVSFNTKASGVPSIMTIPKTASTLSTHAFLMVSMVPKAPSMNSAVFQLPCAPFLQLHAIAG
ncbi:UNVERIFIED_CONTAM: hypothetical protein HDU68_006695, partial [Siphonaria sp. JEL0065]